MSVFLGRGWLSGAVAMVWDMSAWQTGYEIVAASVKAGELQQLQGEAANGAVLVEQAVRTLGSAQRVCDDDPRTAVVLAYDAARCAAEGVLAQQGLRATGHKGASTDGHHAIVSAIVRAQFGEHFAVMEQWRRRRNDLSYPSKLNVVDSAEAAEAIADAGVVVEAAGKLIDSGALGMWR